MLTRLLEEILNESVSMSDINDAIDKHQRVIINYHTDGKDVATDARVIEVYAYGLTKSGNPVIRAFEPYGDTTTRVPAWKFFRLDRISDWKPTKQTFSRPASEYYKGLGDFNKDGDLTMSIVYKVAKFDKSANQEDNVYKTDTELGMERLKQQLSNPINIKDLQKTAQNPQQPTNVENNNTEEEPYKTETERGMERLKQQLNNPQYLDQYRDNKDIENLRKKLGNVEKPITLQDLKQRLSSDNNTEEEPYKTETERGMERLKQQLNNPRRIDLSQIPSR